MKSIIVDDEILVRKGIMSSVNWAELGIEEVYEASNGEKALELILDKKIDIVITDIKMPKMDGLTLIEKLKLYRPEAITIVLSCVNDMESVRRALKFGGALDYVPKLSMTTEELTETLKRAIVYLDENKRSCEREAKILPNFFTAEQEEMLRQAIEYGEGQDLNKIMEEVRKNAYVLREHWAQSREWQDIYGTFSNMLKKYHFSSNAFFAKYKMITEILEEAKSVDDVICYLTQIGLEVRTLIQTEKKKIYDDTVNKAILYIQKNYNQNLKLKEVAEHIGMSETYFSKYFKKIMGVNFNDYLNRVKIEKAKELLMHKKLTIQQVSEMTGYSNCSYFTQLFKEVEGVTPKQYQKNNWNALGIRE